MRGILFGVLGAIARAGGLILARPALSD